MKIKQAIDRADKQTPNGYTLEQKIAWLNTLDHMIYNEIILAHEGYADVTFNGYDETDIETELLAPEPYCQLYVYWLNAKIDEQNDEANRYANDSAQYNALYTEYARWYTRTHMPRKVSQARYF